MKDWVTIIVLSLVTASIAVTITKTLIFKGFREFADKLLPSKVAKVFHCPYCLGHWISLGLWLIYRPNILHVVPVIDQAMAVFVIISLASIAELPLCLALVVMELGLGKEVDK